MADGLGDAEVKRKLREALRKGEAAARGLEGTRAAKAKAAARDFRLLFEGNEALLDAVILTGMARAEGAGQRRELQRKAAADGARRIVQHEADRLGGACSSHAELNGLALPHDDGTWRDWWPPNCWLCGCGVAAMRQGRAASKRVFPAGEEEVRRILGSVSDKQDVFAPVEHRLLPHADALTKSFKTKGNNRKQHGINARIWSGECGLEEAMRERYAAGVDLYAFEQHSVSSRGETSMDLTVLSGSLPRHLGGHVVSITDTGFKRVYRSCVSALHDLRNDTGAREAARSSLADEDPEQAAVRIMKDIPLFGWPAGQTIAITTPDLLLDVAEKKVWIRFNFRTDSQTGQHGFFMSNALYFQNHLLGLRRWNILTRGTSKRDITIHTLKKGPGNTPDHWIQDG